MELLNAIKLNIMLLTVKEPMDILGQRLGTGVSNTSFWENISDKLGIPQLWQIVIGTGGVIAGIVIMLNLFKLLIVNYPKTVTQTKQKVTHAFVVIAILAMLVVVADLILSMIQTALDMHY